MNCVVINRGFSLESHSYMEGNTCDFQIIDFIW